MLSATWTPSNKTSRFARMDLCTRPPCRSFATAAKSNPPITNTTSTSRAASISTPTEDLAAALGDIDAAALLRPLQKLSHYCDALGHRLELFDLLATKLLHAD